MSRRKRSTAPVSFFSFQDIITSVTGIMLLVTLMMTLELVTRIDGTPKHRTARYTSAMSRSIEQATTEATQIERFLQQSQAELKRFASLDAAALARAAEGEQSHANTIDAENARLEKEKTRVAADRDAVQRQWSGRESDRHRLERLRNETADLKNKLASAQQENRIFFNPAPGAAKKAILIELQPGSFLAAEAGKSSPPDRFGDLNAFGAWASGRSPQREYFVLLIKPDAAGMFDEVRTLLQSKGFDIGYDLLPAEQSAINALTGAGL